MKQPVTGTAIMTVKEAANYARVTRETIDAAIQKGELKVLQIRVGTRRIRLADLERWLDSKSTKGSR